MRETLTQPTGRERVWGDEEIIVSKTDVRGIITYANRTFLDVSGYSEEEMVGRPHNVLRHPDMPRCIFKLLWDAVEAGKEVFAYIKNLAKNGDHYWVFAQVTPTFDTRGRIIGYHSNQRCPTRHHVRVFGDLYLQLRSEEQRYADRQMGMTAGGEMLQKIVDRKKLAYDAFVLSS